MINEVIEQGDHKETLNALKMETAQLQNVDAKQSIHYQNLLVQKKRNKSDVSIC